MSTEADSPQMDVYGGVRWSAVSAWGQQAIHLVITIVLARLLQPQDYGLLAMTAVFIGFLGIFSTMGFGMAVVQRREVSNALLSSLFYVTLAVAGLLAMATVAAAPVCAWIYRDPRVLPIMAALSLNFLLSAPGIIPLSLLRRRMRFDRIAIVQLSTKIIGGALAISLAASGWGVWALVCPGLFFGSPMKTVLFFVLSGWRPRLIFRWSEVRSVFNFGANVTGFGVFNYFARNADNFIIGAFLGAGPLGFYSLAYGILTKPRDVVTYVVSQVLLPAFSRMQDDDARLKAAYLRACGGIALLTFPMMLGMLVVARPFVDVVLGAKWLPAVPLICIFAPLGMVQSIWSTVGQLFLAKGRADWQLRWGLFAGTVIIVSFLVGVPWGVVGVAISYTAVCAILLPLGLYIPFQLVSGLRMRDLAATLLPHGISAGTMAVAVACFRLGLTGLGVGSDSLLHLALSVVFGAATYVLLVYCIRPPALADVQRLLLRVSFISLRRSVRDEPAGTDADAARNAGALSN